MDEIPVIDSHLLKAARRRLGWSQVELAQKAGVSQSIISRLEAEKPPFDCKVSNLIALATSLMVPVADLLCYKTNPQERILSEALEPTFAAIVSMVAKRDYLDQHQAALILEGYLTSLLYRDDNELSFADPNVDIYDD